MASLFTGNPNIHQDDFTLGRKLAVAGVAWAVGVDLALTATHGVLLLTPSTANLTVTGMWLDSSVVNRFQWGWAASVASPSTVTPVNLNSLSQATAIPNMTAQSSTGAITGYVQMGTTDVPAASGFPYVDLSNNPIYIAAAGALGFVVFCQSITGNMRVMLNVHQYNY